MKDLFTIRQVCQCCGISRATVLRLEEKGLLTPALTDPKSGYRYYDNHNVSLVMQVKMFLGMGMTYDDIQEYYHFNGSPPALLQRLEQRLFATQRAYEEMKLRIGNAAHVEFEFIQLPEYVCYQKDYRSATTDDRYWAMYHLYHEAVEKGYRFSSSEPLFIINRRTDFLEGSFSEEATVDFTCCIPLEPEFAPPEAVAYPSCQAFSGLFRGDYSVRAQAYDALGAKMRELGLKPAGDVRVLSLVAPYVGRHIPADQYVSRIVVPIEGEASNNP